MHVLPVMYVLCGFIGLLILTIGFLLKKIDAHKQQVLWYEDYIKNIKRRNAALEKQLGYPKMIHNRPGSKTKLTVLGGGRR